ncbi:MAG TPA: hypothetical protein VMI31_00605 [Fimbriimonadaceae bacterium]|nr:hypothetical protein [Fimbriimonadaceae bacterium]
MKAAISSFLLLLAVVSGAQVKMKVLVNGQQVGTAALFLSRYKTGDLNQDISINLDVNGHTASFETKMLMSPSGKPIRESSEETDGMRAKTTTMVYGPTNLQVRVTINGKSTTSTVAIPKGNIADASAVWFVAIRPKVGTTTTYSSYNETLKKWESKTAKYLGDDKVPESQATAHHIHHQDGDLWVDDKGMPLRIELSQGGAQMVLVRS